MQSTTKLSLFWAFALLVFMASVSACSLSTTGARGRDDAPTLAPTRLAQQPTSTSTLRPSSTPQPTATSTRVIVNTGGNSSSAPPAYSIRQLRPGPVCSVYPSGSAVNVRSGPGTQFPIIGVLPQNNWALARHVDPSGTWYQINVPNTPVDGGWVSNTVTFIETPCTCGASGCNPIIQPTVTPTLPLPPPPVTDTPPGDTCVLRPVGGDVPIYGQPSVDAGEWGRLNFGNYLPLAGRTSDGWFAVNVNTGIVPEPGLFGLRWLRDDGTVQLVGPCDGLPTLNYQYPSPGERCVIEVLPDSIVPVYRYPWLSSEMWGQMESGWSYDLVGQTPDGWYAFDPVVAQAPNVGIWRLRWIRVEEAVQVRGCDNIPTVVYTG